MILSAKTHRETAAGHGTSFGDIAIIKVEYLTKKIYTNL
jgi:hypothetical protein